MKNSSGSVERDGPHPVDVAVGAAIRLRRKSLGLSQEALADGLGVTFQQVQKYERGTNRISASRLFDTARFLKAPVELFFRSVGGDAEEGQVVSDSEQSVHAFLATREGIELAQAFPKIGRPATMRRVLELVRSLTED